jgi:DNA end-binding protein Ku
MARPIWKGAVTFGLVNVPVVLYPAEQTHQLSFNMLDKHDFQPIGYKRYNKTTGKEVAWADVVKGYEYEPGQFVVMSDEDFRRANVEQSRGVTIETFVDASHIPPQFFETPYYLVPDQRGQKVYALLRETLRETGKVGIGQVVIRTTHHLAAVMPYEDVLLMLTLRYANEVRDRKEFELPPVDAKAAGIKPQELELAKRLIVDMAGPWKPEQFENTYSEDLMKRIEEKIQRGETKVLTPPAKEGEAAPSAQVIDLMALLKQSLEKPGAKTAPKPAKRAPATKAKAANEAEPKAKTPAKRKRA